MRDFAHQIVYLAIFSFFLVLQIIYSAKTPARILTQNTLYTPFCPQNHHFGTLFRQDKLSLENAFNIGHVLSKLPLIVIVAP